MNFKNNKIADLEAETTRLKLRLTHSSEAIDNKVAEKVTIEKDKLGLSCAKLILS